MNNITLTDEQIVYLHSFLSHHFSSNNSVLYRNTLKYFEDLKDKILIKSEKKETLKKLFNLLLENKDQQFISIKQALPPLKASESRDYRIYADGSVRLRTCILSPHNSDYDEDKTEDIRLDEDYVAYKFVLRELIQRLIKKEKDDYEKSLKINHEEVVKSRVNEKLKLVNMTINNIEEYA